MTEKYLITLKPFGRFYFGTSNSFAESFFARSSMFPPQTTLIGALRYTLLKQNKLLDKDLRYPQKDSSGNITDKVKSLTGLASMKTITENTENYFGIVGKISPVFICHQSKGELLPHNFYFPVPFDVIFKRNSKKGKEITGLEKILFEKIPGTNNYTTNKITKEYSADLLGGDIFWESYLNKKDLTLTNTFSYDKVFINDSQPGIGRNDKRTTVEGKYYIKKDFRLHNDFSFGIIVHFSEKPPLENDDIFIGGERSIFRMNLIKINEMNEGIINNHIIMKKLIDEEMYFGDFDGSMPLKTVDESAIVFISPFFGNGKIEEIGHSVINERYSPRMLGAGSLKTNTFNVIPPRSVIYPGGELKIKETFNIPRLIGYNFTIKF